VSSAIRNLFLSNDHGRRSPLSGMALSPESKKPMLKEKSDQELRSADMKTESSRKVGSPNSGHDVAGNSVKLGTDSGTVASPGMRFVGGSRIEVVTERASLILSGMSKANVASLAGDCRGLDLAVAAVASVFFSLALSINLWQAA
jgi:hypothetical protein